MASYYWIHNNGEMKYESHPKEYYQLNLEQLKEILIEALSGLHNDAEIASVADNIFLVHYNNATDSSLKRFYVCVKGVTPGGRAEKHPYEFRIQQSPLQWNRTLELAGSESIPGILLGVYFTDNLSSPIFCAWQLKETDEASGTPRSKQIDSKTISRALTSGFSQSQTKNELVCAFRKEFLFFYLQNATWLHEKVLNALIPNAAERIGEQPEREVELIDLLTRNINSSPGINRIYYGAPGTGKSYGIQNFIKENGIHDYSDKESHANVFRVTLHPEYSYNDFIGQVMPVVKREDDSSTIEYEFVPQIFTQALARAFKKRVDGEPVFLILEEMSRANVAAVFGDLFQLLDRDSGGVSEYKIDNALIATTVFGETNSTEKIFLPENLYILGTVNTSDQNVFVMDTAFKRRFEFEYISTDSIIENKNDFSFELTQDDESVIELSWLTLFPKINDFIVKKEEAGGLGLTEDKQLGQFFIKFKENEGSNSEINEYNLQQIRGKLLQYLWNDVEMVSYSTHRIFKNEISSFGKLYTFATNNKNFFSHEFMQSLQREEV